MVVKRKVTAQEVDHQVGASADADGVGDLRHEVGDEDRDGPQREREQRDAPAHQEAERGAPPVHERVRRAGQSGEEEQLDDHAAALMRLTASSKRMLSAL